MSAGAWLQPSSHLPAPLSRKARAWQWQPWHWALLLPQERALDIRHPHRLQSGALGPFPRQSKRVGALRGRSGSSGGKPPLCKLSTNSHLGVSDVTAWPCAGKCLACSTHAVHARAGEQTRLGAAHDLAHVESAKLCSQPLGRLSDHRAALPAPGHVSFHARVHRGHQHCGPAARTRP